MGVPHVQGVDGVGMCRERSLRQRLRLAADEAGGSGSPRNIGLPMPSPGGDWTLGAVGATEDFKKRSLWSGLGKAPGCVGRG